MSDVLDGAIPIKAGKSKDILADATPIAAPSSAQSNLAAAQLRSYQAQHPNSLSSLITPPPSRAETDQQMQAIEGSSQELGPVAEDPIYEAQKHPYITAGILGSILGPTVPFLEGLAGASAAGSAALGAGEQMAITGAGDLGARAAGPNHPYLGLALGLGIPAAIPGAAGFMLGTGSARRALSEGADVAHAEQAAEQASAAKAATKEALSNKDAIAKAATDQGNANLAELAQAHEKAAQRIGAFGEGLDKRAQLLKEQGEAASEAARKEVAPAEAERQRAELIGKTPEQTAAEQALPPTEAAARRTAIRGAVFGPIQRRSEELGAQFEEHYKPYRNNEIDLSPVSSAISDELKYAQEHGPFSAAATKVLNLGRGMAGAARGSLTPEDALNELYGEKEVAEMAPAEKRRLLQFFSTGKSVGKAEAGVPEDLHPEMPKPTRYPSGKEDRAGAEFGLQSETPPATVQDALRLRRAAGKVMRSDNDWASKNAAWRVIKSVDSALERANVPKPGGLNAEWKDFRDIFDHNFSRSTSETIEPSNMGAALFEEPQRALNLYRHATPEEAQVLNNNFADYANTKGYTLADIGSKVNPEVRRAIFGDSALANKQTWLKMEPKEIELKTLLQSSPTAQAQYGSAFQSRMTELMQNQSGDIRKEGIALARQLGPAGKPLEAALFKAKSPQEVMQAAQQLAQMAPEQVVSQLAASQKSPGGAAFERSLVADRTARERFQQVAQQGKQLPLSGQPLTGDAARQALMKLKPSKGEEALKRFLKFRMLWYGGSILGGGLMGHVAPYALGMGALDGAMSTFAGIRAGGRAMLRNPKIAEMAWRALETPKGLNGLRLAGKASADIMALTAAQQAREKMGQTQDEDNEP